MSDPADIVLRFLASIGRPAEAEQYLALYRRGPRPILHVSHAVLRDAHDALTVDLRFLVELGIEPVLVIGAERAKNADAHAARIAAIDDLEGTVCAPRDVPGVIAAGRLPIVALTEPDGDTRAALDARFDVIAALAAELGTTKIVFVGRRSGLQATDTDRVVSIVELADQRPPLPGPQADLLRQIARIVDRVPHRLTVSVTSPLDLLRELFTVKGAGTLVRRGSQIARLAGADVDRARLATLVEEAFGRKLVADFLDRAVRAVYVADDYRGAAVITDTALAPYLSKFAVTLEARGEGVGGDLWRAITSDLPRLFWRSRPGNPISAWYRDQCHGLQRADEWTVFWRGLAPAEIPDAIAHACGAPPDFTER